MKVGRVLKMFLFLLFLFLPFKGGGDPEIQDGVDRTEIFTTDEELMEIFFLLEVLENLELMEEIYLFEDFEVLFIQEVLE